MSDLRYLEGRPRVSLEINDCIIRALIDTGATCCVMRDETRRRARIPLDDDAPSPPVLTANGGRIETLGHASFRIGGMKIDAIVANNDLSEELIVGADALTRGHAQLDFEGANLHWKGKERKLEFYGTPTQGSVIWCQLGKIINKIATSAQ